MQVRLQKFLSDCGIASRRKAELLISDGHITVNGQTVTEMGVKIDTFKDKVCFDGNDVAPFKEKVYLALNKPRGVISAVSDPLGRRVVTDFVDAQYKLFPIGRLDYNTSGLILLTNDGEFANKIMHPRNNIEKTYIVKASGKVTPENLEKLRRGVKIEGGRTCPATAEIMEKRENSTVVAITIHEGRNRQVRKMFETIGAKVMKLERISIGEVSLGDLPPGQIRRLTKEEIKSF